MGNRRRSGHALVYVILGIAFIGMLLGFNSCESVPMGHRGVVTTMGKPEPTPLMEGANFVWPFIQNVKLVDTRSTIINEVTEAFTSDTQSVKVSWSVNYSLNPAKVVEFHSQNMGDPFQVLIKNQVLERIKVHTVKYNANDVVTMRDKIKADTLTDVKRIAEETGNFVFISEMNITDIDLDATIRKAIEEKMVQDQQTQKAKYRLEQQKVEEQIANTLADAQAYQITTQADAEAKAIAVKGQALRENAGLVELIIAEKWDGKSPTVVVSGSGGSTPTSILLPLDSNVGK
jgi:prohibitin 2